MLFVIVMHDRPNARELRSATAERHREWVGENTALMYVGGPLLDDDGESIIGSMIIADFPDRTTVGGWIAGEPYNQAGLFESVVIRQLDARIERGAPATSFSPGPPE